MWARTAHAVRAGVLPYREADWWPNTALAKNNDAKRPQAFGLPALFLSPAIVAGIFELLLWLQKPASSDTLLACAEY